MKKVLLTLLLATMVSLVTMSQEIISKKGEPFLPEQGDWALGIDVAPFFNYVGNIANGNDNNSSPTFQSNYPLQIFGKWFKEEKFAWRGRIRLLGLNNATDVGYVRDDLNSDPSNPYKQVEDQRKRNSMNTTLAFGMEWRKGKTRLQGFYGAELVLSFGSSKDSYTYGNAISDANVSPSTYNFGTNLYPNYGYRVTEINYGTTFFFGARPFIGVEYFLFPKISIGGEFGWSIGYSSSKPQEITSEYYDYTISGRNTNTEKSGQYAKSQFKIDNDNASGSIKLMMHF